MKGCGVIVDVDGEHVVWCVGGDDGGVDCVCNIVSS